MTRRPAGWLVVGSGSLIVVAGAGVGVPAAVINKALADRGHGTFATPADLVNNLFSGSTHVATGMQVITAFVLLAALLAVIAGVWRIVRGDRGGVEVTASGIFGLVGLIAAITVVM